MCEHLVPKSTLFIDITIITVLLIQILRPPPRKRCEAELYQRLTYLLKELEPWEQKLVAANKRAKIKVRKEQENYKEEPPVQVSG